MMPRAHRRAVAGHDEVHRQLLELAQGVDPDVLAVALGEVGQRPLERVAGEEQAGAGEKDDQRVLAVPGRVDEVHGLGLVAVGEPVAEGDGGQRHALRRLQRNGLVGGRAVLEDQPRTRALGDDVDCRGRRRCRTRGPSDDACSRPRCGARRRELPGSSSTGAMSCGLMSVSMTNARVAVNATAAIVGKPPVSMRWTQTSGVSCSTSPPAPLRGGKRARRRQSSPPRRLSVDLADVLGRLRDEARGPWR